MAVQVDGRHPRGFFLPVLYVSQNDSQRVDPIKREVLASSNVDAILAGLWQPPGMFPTIERGSLVQRSPAAPVLSKTQGHVTLDDSIP